MPNHRYLFVNLHPPPPLGPAWSARYKHAYAHYEHKLMLTLSTSMTYGLSIRPSPVTHCNRWAFWSMSHVCRAASVSPWQS
jgi:hypothetical protein